MYSEIVPVFIAVGNVVIRNSNSLTIPVRTDKRSPFKVLLDSPRCRRVFLVSDMSLFRLLVGFYYESNSARLHGN